MCIRDRFTTTRGVGEMIRDAVGRGCREFVVGIGGSATNDGGIGMLQALGWDFLDERGNPVSYTHLDVYTRQGHEYRPVPV